MNENFKVIIEFKENDAVKKRKCGHILNNCFKLKKYKTCNANVRHDCFDLLDKICDNIPDFKR